MQYRTLLPFVVLRFRNRTRGRLAGAESEVHDYRDLVHRTHRAGQGISVVGALADERERLHGILLEQHYSTYLQLLGTADGAGQYVCGELFLQRSRYTGDGFLGQFNKRDELRPPRRQSRDRLWRYHGPGYECMVSPCRLFSRLFRPDRLR